MKKEKRKSAAELQAELGQLELKIQRIKARLERAQARASSEARRKRAHRLITVGAEIERAVGDGMTPERVQHLIAIGAELERLMGRELTLSDVLCFFVAGGIHFQ